ncbi:MAG: ATP-binding protein, partial [Planctomycetia bacterium]|nr:ATP-binding protein [Planctomycetia bacterium]
VLENDFGKNIQQVFALLAENVYCDRISFILCDQTTGHYILENSWYRDENVGPVSQEQLKTLFRVGGDVLRTNQIVCIDDMTLSSDWRRAKYPAKSLLAVPIFMHDRPWAILVVASLSQVHHFSEVEKKLMRAMANIVTLAQIRDRQNDAIRRADQEKQMILNNIGIPIWLYDARGRLLRANTAVSELAGVSREEELTPEKDREIFCDRVTGRPCPPDVVITTGKPDYRELDWRGRSYRVFTEPVFDESGQLVRIVRSAVDVSDLNQLVRNQQVINACFETLFHEGKIEQAIHNLLKIVCERFGGTRCYILQFDLKRKSSRAFAEYATPDAGTMFGKGIHYQLSEDEPWVEHFLKKRVVLWKDMKDPKALDFVGAWSRPYISEFDVRSLFVAPVFLHGELWGDFGVTYEKHPCPEFDQRERELLTTTSHLIEVALEREETHNNLVQALRRAQVADQAKSFFIASVSHEIRTPLNSVIGFSELLRDGGVSPEEQKEYLDNIMYSGNALLQLVNDVLDLSRLEADQEKIVTSPIDFSELGHEVMKVFSFRATDRNLKLIVDIPDMPRLELDRQRVRQVLFNLIGNAVKFTEHGSITLRAEFHATDRERGTLNFAVVDTGIGIAEEDQGRLMKPFVQLLNIRGANVTNQGTGLGLAISRRMVEKMGGKLDLRSKPGEGSTFEARLENVIFYPKVPSTDAGKTRETGPTENSSEETSEDSAAIRAEISVLVVDDVALNLKVLCTMCEKIGVGTIVSATTGAAALDELEKRSFDFVLTDLWMPEMDGHELLKKIRADSRFDRVIVIAVTADREAMRDTRFDHMILKPVTMESLKKILTK